MERILFYVIAIIAIVFALASVISRKMLRSVIYLLFVLCSIAGVYFMMDYNFLAAIQLTVYAGGIVVLIIFSVLLVHHIELELEIAKFPKQLATGLLCLAGLGVFLYTIYMHDFQVIGNQTTTSTHDIGSKLLSYEEGGFILPFEVISILLLAVMVGAIILAKGTLTSNSETKQP